MAFWNRDLMPRSSGKRQRLRLRDWILLVPVLILSWVIPFTAYRFTGHSTANAVWVASWVTLIATVGTGVTWMYPNIVDRDTPWQFLKIAGGFFAAAAIAIGLQLHAGGRNLFEVLINGVPDHARWHWSKGFSWYFTLLGAGYVALLSAVRRWLWLTIDRNHNRTSADRDSEGE